MKDISKVIEFVCDSIDRGDINTVKEALEAFAEFPVSAKVDMEFVEKCLEEEFEEGFSENWELVREL